MPAQITLPFLESMAEAASDNVPVVVVGTTAASTALTALGDMSGVAVGAVVTGLGMVASPPTTIVAIDNAAHTATLSQAGTGAHVGTPLTFINPDLVLADAQCVLYSNNPALTLATALGDLVQPSYAGYVIQDVSWNAIYQDPTSKDIVFESNLLTWSPSAVVSPAQAIMGYGLTSLIGGVQTLQRAENLPLPKAFAGPLNQCAFTIQVRMPAALVWGTVNQTV